MKLGKIKKELAILMGMMVICPMTFAQESASTQQTYNEVVKENVEENRVDEGVQMISEKELIELIKKNGVKVGVSKNIDGVKVTVEYIWADHCFEKVLLSIEHLDKRPFNENIDSFFLDIQLKTKEGLKRYKVQQAKSEILDEMSREATLSEIVKAFAAVDETYKKFIKSDGTVDEKHAKEVFEKDKIELDSKFIAANNLVGCDYQSDVPYKKYFIISEGDLENRGAGQMVLDLEGYIENEEVETPITSEAMEYLSTHPQAQVKDRQLNAYEQRLLEAINRDMEKVETVHLKVCYEQERDKYLKYLEERPQIVLANQDLALKVDDRLEDFIIKGIGFVDEALHISYVTEDYQTQWLTIYDEKGCEIPATYSGEDPDIDEEGNYIHMHYDIYPIKNLEELKKCKIKAGTLTVPIYGKEHALFDVNIKPSKEKVIQVNKKVKLEDSDEAILKTVTQTDLTLCLKFLDPNKNLVWIQDMKIVTKDGTDDFYSNMSKRLGNIATYVYDISEIKGDIEKIMIGDIEVRLN